LAGGHFLWRRLSRAQQALLEIRETGQGQRVEIKTQETLKRVYYGGMPSDSAYRSVKMTKLPAN